MIASRGRIHMVKMDAKCFREFLTLLPTYSVYNACMNLGVNADLFKTLCELNEPISAEELAAKCRVKGRLLTEWLQVFVIAGVLKVERNLYYIPEEIKQVFREPETATALSLGEFTLTFGARQKKFLECFRQDGPRGLAVSETPEMLDFQEKDPYNTYTATFEADFLDRIEGLREKLESGVELIEVGCGGGGLLRVIAEHFPKSTFTGVDIACTLMADANKEVSASGLVNCTFDVQDVECFPRDWSNRFDIVFLKNVFHDLPFPHKGATELSRIVKDNGTVLFWDFNLNPDTEFSDMHTPVFTAGSMYYCIAGGIEAEDGDPIGCARTGNAQVDILKEFFTNVNVIRVNKGYVLHVCTK